MLAPVSCTCLTMYDRYQDEQNDVGTEPDITTWSFPAPEVSNNRSRISGGPPVAAST